MIEVNVPLEKYTRLQVGGCAEKFFMPETVDELLDFMKTRDGSEPLFVLGKGSNTLVRSGGIKGTVIHLKYFKDIRVEDTKVIAGAGANNRRVAKQAGGLEFLAGIPGWVGGAVFMNAGIGDGQEVKDILTSTKVVTEDGEVQDLSVDELHYEYRKSSLPKNSVVIEATFNGVEKNSDEIAKKIQEIDQYRDEHQPHKLPTAGSTFKNPKPHSAWKLIEEAGCRGLTVGNAQMSEMHCNFMVNLGGATAKDFETLIETVIKRVKENSGIELEPEVRIQGEVS